MKHKQIVNRLSKLIAQASSDPISRWTGFARVLESLIQYAEESKNQPLIHSLAQPLTEVLKLAESSGDFQAIDFHDQRSDDDLYKDIIQNRRLTGI